MRSETQVKMACGMVSEMFTTMDAACSGKRGLQSGCVDASGVLWVAAGTHIAWPGTTHRRARAGLRVAPSTAKGCRPRVVSRAHTSVSAFQTASTPNVKDPRCSTRQD